jgi:RecA/RadA recombinase
MSMLNSLIKAAGIGAVLAIDGVPSGDVVGYTDTGAYALNALVSASIYDGIADGKVTALAGEEATGKTFFALSIVKYFMKQHPEGIVFYFESEGSITKGMLAAREGLDLNRFIVKPVVTLQEFRTSALNVLTEYEKIKPKERPKMLFVLDSLGMLSTTKEITDSEAGAETKDMTRTQLTKAVFRVITLKLSKLQVPMIITNHTYQTMETYAKTIMSGGSGLKYAASTILFLRKSKHYDEKEKEYIGSYITVVAAKSRFTKEGAKVELRLNHITGLDPYYGLLDLAVDAGVWTKVSTKIQLFPGSEEKAIYGKKIENNPKKYFTDEVLKKIDAHCKVAFSYGTATNETVEIEDDDEEDGETE